MNSVFFKYNNKIFKLYLIIKQNVNLPSITLHTLNTCYQKCFNNEFKFQFNYLSNRDIWFIIANEDDITVFFCCFYLYKHHIELWNVCKNLKLRNSDTIPANIIIDTIMTYFFIDKCFYKYNKFKLSILLDSPYYKNALNLYYKLGFKHSKKDYNISYIPDKPFLLMSLNKPIDNLDIWF